MKQAPFLVLSATFPDDPRIVEVGERAAWLFLCMACDCRLQRSDGVVAAHRLPRLGVPGWQTRLAALTAAGLVHQVNGGYVLPGYLNWNPSEHSYLKRAHYGTAGACRRHHPDGCAQAACAESREWLTRHGYPLDPNGSPNGSPTSKPTG